jgi:glycoside/pentoside/hexuronide:cation symporter, GPH family
MSNIETDTDADTDTDTSIYKHKSLVLEPTSEKTKLIYASPRLGINLFMGTVDFALLFLYNDAYQLSSVLVGVALMLGKLSIAAAQFIVAWLSDHTVTKWGRRKPYLIVIAPILAVSFILLLLPGLVLGPNPEEMTLFTWFVVFNCLAQAAYSVTSVYHSWTAEQFPVQERPRVSQNQNVFNFIGLGVIVLFSLLVLTDVKDQLVDDPAKIPTVLIVSVLIFAFVMVGLIYFCAIYMPIEKTPIDKEANYKEELKLIMKDKNFMSVVLVHGVGSLGWAMVNAIMLGYIDTVLMLEGLNLYIAAGILMIGLVGTIEFWRRKIESWGKKKTLTAVFGLAIIAFPFSLIGMYAWSVNLAFGIFFAFILATTQAGWALFPYILYADLAEDFEKRHGKMKAGLFTGFPSILLNIFQAIALLISGYMLALPDIENVEGNSFSAGYVWWGPFCAIVFLVTLIIVKKFVNLDFAWEKGQETKQADSSDAVDEKHPVSQ